MIYPVVLETLVHSYRLWTISGLLFFYTNIFCKEKMANVYLRNWIVAIQDMDILDNFRIKLEITMQMVYTHTDLLLL
jgi:hypothetical protein